MPTALQREQDTESLSQQLTRNEQGASGASRAYSLQRRGQQALQVGTVPSWQRWLRPVWGHALPYRVDSLNCSTNRERREERRERERREERGERRRRERRGTKRERKE